MDIGFCKKPVKELREIAKQMGLSTTGLKKCEILLLIERNSFIEEEPEINFPRKKVSVKEQLEPEEQEIHFKRMKVIKKNEEEEPEINFPRKKKPIESVEPVDLEKIKRELAIKKYHQELQSQQREIDSMYSEDKYTLIKKKKELAERERIKKQWDSIKDFNIFDILSEDAIFPTKLETILRSSNALSYYQYEMGYELNEYNRRTKKLTENQIKFALSTRNLQPSNMFINDEEFDEYMVELAILYHSFDELRRSGDYKLAIQEYKKINKILVEMEKMQDKKIKRQSEESRLMGQEDVDFKDIKKETFGEENRLMGMEDSDAKDIKKVRFGKKIIEFIPYKKNKQMKKLIEKSRTVRPLTEKQIKKFVPRRQRKDRLLMEQEDVNVFEPEPEPKISFKRKPKPTVQERVVQTNFVPITIKNKKEFEQKRSRSNPAFKYIYDMLSKGLYDPTDENSVYIVETLMEYDIV